MKKPVFVFILVLVFFGVLTSCEEATATKNEPYGDVRDHIIKDYIYTPYELEIYEAKGFTIDLLNHPEKWTEEDVSRYLEGFKEVVSPEKIEALMQSDEENEYRSTSRRLDKEGRIIEVEKYGPLTTETIIQSIEGPFDVPESIE